MRDNLLADYKTEDFYRHRPLIYLKAIDQFCPINDLFSELPDTHELVDSKKYITAFENITTDHFDALDKILFENAIIYSTF